MLLPSRKSQLPANSFRSQYRLRWNLALPEQDRSNRRQMDGPMCGPAPFAPHFVVLKNLAQKPQADLRKPRQN